MGRLLNHSESPQVWKVASLLAEALSPAGSALGRDMPSSPEGTARNGRQPIGPLPLLWPLRSIRASASGTAPLALPQTPPRLLPAHSAAGIRRRSSLCRRYAEMMRPSETGCNKYNAACAYPCSGFHDYWSGRRREASIVFLYRRCETMLL